MKLTTQVLPQVRHFLHQSGWFTPIMLAALVALELFGRQWHSDVYDLAGAGILALIMGSVGVRHRMAKLAWVSYLGKIVWSVARFTDRFKIDFGPDLRGNPPIPRRMPWTVHLGQLGLLLWCVGAAALWYFFPQGWRNFAIQGSYLLYLAVIVPLWGMTLIGSLGGIYLPFRLFNALFPSAQEQSDEPRMSRPQSAFLLVYVAAIIALYCFVPLWVSLAVAGTILFGVFLINLWPTQTGIQFIWRASGSQKVWSIPTPRLLLIGTSLAVLLPSALILTTAGGHVLKSVDADPTMPVTTMLGSALAWLMPGTLIAGGTFVFLFWRQNPSRPCRPSVHVTGLPAAALRPQIKTIFQDRGWKIAFEPESPNEVDVRIRIVEPIRSDAREFDPDWPLCVSLEDLLEGEVIDRLERRDEIQKRRLLLRGLKRVFKSAADREFDHGSGYWVAPHLWFMPGLTRDEMTDQESGETNLIAQVVGPGFHEVMHRHVREYVYRLFRSLQVDLIFVEDGIDFRKLKKVLRVLFEVHDKSAGKRRAEEIQFQGLPKVKVLIHEFDIDEPFRSSTYPEPRFEDLGRARILHVFRDRGDEEELIEPPYDFSITPVPMFA